MENFFFFFLNILRQKLDELLTFKVTGETGLRQSPILPQRHAKRHVKDMLKRHDARDAQRYAQIHF